MYRETKIRIKAYFSLETIQARRKECNIFKILKGNYKARILYPRILSFKNESEIKTFSKNWSIILHSSSALLKGLLKYVF